MNIAIIRDRIAIIVVSAYILFNYGFQVVRIPFNEGPPIGEILLLISLLFIDYKYLWNRIRHHREIYIVITIWFLCITHLLIDIPKYGMWALRDASHLVEMSFILLGFLSAKRSKGFIETHYAAITVIIILYSLLYVFNVDSTKLVPIIVSSSGSVTPIITHVNTPSLLLLIGFGLLISDYNRNKYAIWANLLIVTITLFTIVIFQSRTILLQMAVMAIFVMYLKPKYINTLPILGVAFILLLYVYTLIGIEPKGRLGISYDLNTLVNHILAIFGKESEGLEAAASGVGQRLGWWYKILLDSTESWTRLLLGKGYGVPLVDFIIANGVVVREPHNSIISMFARTGLIGMLLLIVLWYQLIRTWIRTHKLATYMQDKKLLLFIRLLGMFFILAWVFSLGEDAFEKPFWAIPFYYFWGVILRINSYMLDEYSFRQNALIEIRNTKLSNIVEQRQ